MIVQRGLEKPPSYFDPRLLSAPIGHFYDVISNGYGKMNDYSVQVAPADRWAIAAYIRALQLSQHAPASMVQGKPMNTASAESAGAKPEHQENAERK
jgi:hypothetical protein